MAPSSGTTAVIFVCLCAIFMFFNYVSNRRHNFDEYSHQPLYVPHSYWKRILLWKPTGGDPDDLYLGLVKRIFEEAGCEYQNCIAMNDRKSLPSYQWDAVLFLGYSTNMINVRSVKKYFKRRSPHQLFVFMELESPRLHSAFVDMMNFFNLTSTYRLDSDIPQPYGWITHKQHNSSFTNGLMNNIYFSGSEKQPYNGPDDLLLNKTGMIAWFVSHCNVQSRRDEYARKLAKYIQVDIYGGCGTLKCSIKDREKCYKMVETKYKFYLAFENSLCTDYVTEKLYNILKLNIIPIVMGGANYSKIVPPHSVINVMDFKSVKDLADYVKKVAEDPKLYNEYFWWKNYYSVKTSRTHVLCKLCEILNDNSTQHKTYHRVSDWFHKTDVCYNPLKWE